MALLTKFAIPPGTLAAMDQPEIIGDGVRLRPWLAADREHLVAAYQDPAIQRWHCRTLDDEEARDYILRWSERWQDETGAGWVITERGRLVGQVSLRKLYLCDALAEISYWVLPAERGRRVAPRALTALTTWSFEALNMHRLELYHSTRNPPSCRVAEQSGYLLEGTKRSEMLHQDGWHDMHIHARLRTD